MDLSKLLTSSHPLLSYCVTNTYKDIAEQPIVISGQLKYNDGKSQRRKRRSLIRKTRK